MGLTQADVQKIASLARLKITDEEAETLAAQLDQVITYIEQLNEVDTEGVEPMAHAIEQVNVLAEDTVRDSFSREQILRNAPSRDDECYRVPPVLGE